MKKIFILLFFIANTSAFVAQKKSVNWLIAEQLELHYYKKPKPILIFLETNWCKICKMQSNTTFRNDSVVKGLNDNFYAFKFNAETKDSLFFFNRKYGFNNREKFHELALFLGKHNNQMEFPTTVILNDKFQLLFRKSALVNSTEMLELLQAIK